MSEKVQMDERKFVEERDVELSPRENVREEKWNEGPALGKLKRREVW